jgi:hypothetical protein
MRADDVRAGIAPSVMSACSEISEMKRALRVQESARELYERVSREGRESRVR